MLHFYYLHYYFTAYIRCHNYFYPVLFYFRIFFMSLNHKQNVSGRVNVGYLHKVYVFFSFYSIKYANQSTNKQINILSKIIRNS